MGELRYAEFADRIDVEAYEEAIGFEVTDQNGSNDIGHCFDLYGHHKHGDQTGKFAIERDKRIYNCWVCGGGNLLSLTMELYDWDLQRATNWIYQFAHERDISDERFIDKIHGLLDDYESRQKADTLPYFNSTILTKWHSKEPHSFFAERGISNFVYTRYVLGYDPEHVRHSPIKVKEDSFIGPAIILPHFWRGRTVGWQSRWLSKDRPRWVPKYTNTGDFPAKNTLFNYDRITQGAHDHFLRVIVCESVTTVLFLETLGIPAVATFGATVTEEQLRLLRVFQRGVFLAPDNDSPGVKFANTSTKYLRNYVPVFQLEMIGEDGEGGDLGDFARDTEQLHLHLKRSGYYDYEKVPER